MPQVGAGDLAWCSRSRLATFVLVWLRRIVGQSLVKNGGFPGWALLLIPVGPPVCWLVSARGATTMSLAHQNS